MEIQMSAVLWRSAANGFVISPFSLDAYPQVQAWDSLLEGTVGVF